MIRDDAGNELTYWPISGLIAGQDSQAIVIRVDTPQGRTLTATPSTSATIFARRTGSGDPFVNLALNPIDLSGLSGPFTRFDVYVHAVTGIGPFERIGITVGAAREAPAGWNM